jgi:hypothetical protein
MSENENDFETLRRLLALKRHEIPPPGYFDDFSSQVIARIRASQVAQNIPWLLRLLQAFETRPAYPVAFASALCLLLLFGIVSVEQNPEIGSAVLSPSQYDFATVSALASPTPGQTQPALLAVVDTNSPADLQNTKLFDPPPSPYFHEVDLSQGGN